MNAKAFPCSLSFLLIMLLSSCQGATGNPVLPYPDTIGQKPDQASCLMLGAWDLNFDPASETVEVSPSRHTAGQFDVTGMIPPPGISVNYYYPETYVISVDVTLVNPFTIKGRDVRGIIFTNNGFRLLNPDGWTGLFDIAGGEDINPFKAFAKDQPGRLFDAQTEHTETFEIYLPGGSTSVKFAVIASFPGNCKEPYSFGEFNQDLLYVDNLSEAEIWIDVFDWQFDIDSVSLSCPLITNQPQVTLTQFASDTWSATITNSASAPAGGYEAIISATSGGGTLYTKVIIKVTAEKNTIGLIHNSPGAFVGYTLFAPMRSSTTYLIDNKGNLVHKWDGDYMPFYSVYLLENGNLLKACMSPPGPGAKGNLIREFDWDGNVVWQYVIPYPQYVLHHDIERLPNGNTLAVVQEHKTTADLATAGRMPDLIPFQGLQADVIIEITSGNEIVWEWHAWDHLASVIGGTANGKPVSTDISDPGLININEVGKKSGPDWLHTNSVDYNAALDQIVIDTHNLNELYIIDHSTADYLDPQSGKDAAAGPAGDILYRWGNPSNYQAGGTEDQVFYGQHDAQWIEDGYPGEGNILVFNNGLDKLPEPYSSIEEIVTPLNIDGGYDEPPSGTPFGPASQNWIYIADPPGSFYASLISGAKRQPNGNTLICSGPDGWFFEVNSSGEIVWQYINPVNNLGPQHQGTIIESNNVFRCYRYAPDFPGFDEHDLTPGDPIELP